LFQRFLNRPFEIIWLFLLVLAFEKMDAINPTFELIDLKY